MARYRKKPVIIDAFCPAHVPIPDWFMDKVSTNQIVTHGEYGTLLSCDIHTLEGVMIGSRGDYILKGIAGEIYPCKPDIFANSYELVDTSL